MFSPTLAANVGSSTRTIADDLFANFGFHGQISQIQVSKPHTVLSLAKKGQASEPLAQERQRSFIVAVCFLLTNHDIGATLVSAATSTESSHAWLRLAASSGELQWLSWRCNRWCTYSDMSVVSHLYGPNWIFDTCFFVSLWRKSSYIRLFWARISCTHIL